MIFVFSISEIEKMRLGAANNLKISSLFLSADIMSNPSFKSLSAEISISQNFLFALNNAANRKNLKIRK